MILWFKSCTEIKCFFLIPPKQSDLLKYYRVKYILEKKAALTQDLYILNMIVYIRQILI